MYNIKKISSYGEDIFISNNVEIKHPHLFKIGSHIAIDSGFYITTSAQLGDYIHIGPHVCVIGGKTAQLIMGNFTNIAAGCKIICGSDRFGGDGFSFPTLQPPFRDTLIIKPVIIEDFSGIGSSVTILPGVIIRQGSVVGAGSVVTKNTEPWTIYAGNPAKPIKERRKENMIRLAKMLGYE